MLREMYNRANGDSQTVEIITYLNSNYRRIKNNKRIIDGFFAQNGLNLLSMNFTLTNYFVYIYTFLSSLVGIDRYF